MGIMFPLQNKCFVKCQEHSLQLINLLLIKAMTRNISGGMSDSVQRILQLELRGGAGHRGSCGPCLSEPIPECLHDRTRVSHSDFIYVSIYLHLVQQTFGFFSLPFFFQAYTKISEGSSQPKVYWQPFKALSLGWSKAFGFNTLPEWERSRASEAELAIPPLPCGQVLPLALAGGA